MGTKNVDWRDLLKCNSVEINAQVLPVDMTHQGSLGIFLINLDLAPNLMKSELLRDEQVSKQQELEKKYE